MFFLSKWVCRNDRMVLTSDGDPNVEIDQLELFFSLWLYRSIRLVLIYIVGRSIAAPQSIFRWDRRLFRRYVLAVRDVKVIR